jgi:uncharacterized membrane protein
MNLFMKAKILIPLTNLCLGFVPMLIMSILMKGFWINSQYNFPLVLIPAVLIGDSLFLPILNYRIYIALKQIAALLKPRMTFVIVLFCLLLSTAINSYTHYLWSHDNFTGFMDPTYGTHSAAGWWHYGFSILQMAIIFVYATLWVLTVKQQDEQMFQAFEKAIYIFMAFTLINMSGTFINKDLVFSKRLTPDFAITSVINASMPLIIAILLLSRMKKIHKSTQSNSGG